MFKLSINFFAVYHWQNSGKTYYNRFYNFLERKEVIFSLQFGFWQKYSTTHTLIHLTDKIRHEIDKGNYACGIFVDFPKAFDTMYLWYHIPLIPYTVDHHIVLKKLKYCGVKGTLNKWFASYFSNRKQLVSINCYKSNLAMSNVGLYTRISFVLYFLYFCSINNLHVAIKYCEVHHLADSTITF